MPIVCGLPTWGNVFSVREVNPAIPVKVESLDNCHKQWQKFQAVAIPFKFIKVWTLIPSASLGVIAISHWLKVAAATRPE